MKKTEKKAPPVPLRPSKVVEVSKVPSSGNKVPLRPSKVG